MYRVFEKNPITNEWIDRGDHDGNDQRSAINKARGKSEGEFFAVPESSFHPVRVGKEEIVRWKFESASGEVVEGVAEEIEEPVDVT